MPPARNLHRAARPDRSAAAAFTYPTYTAHDWRPLPAPSATPARPSSGTKKSADAAYILDTFPIVRRRDQAACGHYRKKAMVLAYYNALDAGEADVEVAV
ncbi:MAG: hypothetical protein OXH73_21905 [Caldilineaceae bacterium]|nr:hypothetical protein [Caldilineaceae bacterium]